ncbi:MAG: pentapeptide repeat-containing protein [Candidatus Manganitrophus sp. SA1]|nr:pentapeptide repeat-containing protein [Candidatus Manganitrophus morganii]
MSLKPINDNRDPLYRLLREGRIGEFNARKRKGEKMDLTDSDLGGLDLREVDLKGLDLSGSYFLQTDLRGVDLSQTNLEGASLNGAKVSGTYFPEELAAEEIALSLTHGTRLRYQSRRAQPPKRRLSDILKRKPR